MLQPFDGGKVNVIVNPNESDFANRHLHFLLHLALKFSVESRFDFPKYCYVYGNFLRKKCHRPAQIFCHFSFRCLRKTRLILSSLQSFASPNFEFGSAKIFASRLLLRLHFNGAQPDKFFELRRQRTSQSRSDLSPRSVSGDGANDARKASILREKMVQENGLVQFFGITQTPCRVL